MMDDLARRLNREEIMTHHAPKAPFNASLSDVGGSSVLHDQDFLRFAPALDLSAEEWLRLLQAHSAPPSFRRKVFGEPLEQQLEGLSWGVHDDDPCRESAKLSRRIKALPRMLKLTVLEAIERFWTREAEASSFDERLQHLGLRPCASTHARLAALAHRRLILSEEDGPLADPV